MTKHSKKRAPTPKYISQNQLILEGFESPFERELNPDNRWVRLAKLLPWDDLCSIYRKHFPEKSTGRPDLSPRVVLGSIIIKHLCNLDDRETVDQISENIYMQYFLGYSSFSDAPPFDPSLFVEFRKRLGLEQINAINQRILQIKREAEHPQEKGSNDTRDVGEDPPHKGNLIVDATACPQDIAYPTDLNLLNDAREKSESLLDIAYKLSSLKTKPRNYREKARKDYLKTAQKKRKTHKEIRSAIGKQLRYLHRNIRSIETILDTLEQVPFDRRNYKYWLVIQELYRQQKFMFDTKTKSVDHRIVSIHQPHVRPIVRGKTNAKTEPVYRPGRFGAKINMALVDGFSFLDDTSWEAYNESTRLKDCVEKYRKRFGHYPANVLVDKIYCTRENRRYLKEKGINLRAKPLGRPSKKALSNQVSPGERNPIEGKFGQAKTAYGLNRIRARLANTSESWIASIILVLNLVHLAEVALYWIKVILFSENFIQKENEIYLIINLEPNEC